MSLSLPQHVYYSAEQVRELDRRAIASGIAGIELMSRAGLAVFNVLQERWAEHSPIEVFCGGGNNGGDGYIVAALAATAGMAVRVWALNDALKGDALLARQRAEALGVKAARWQGEVPAAGSVVVDALLGTGLSGQLREPYVSAIAAINRANCPVLSVDIPSGLCSDTGRRLGETVCADVTVSFIGLKLGLATGAAAECVGELCFDDLGVPASVYDSLSPLAEKVDFAPLLQTLGRRPRSAHKGLFGHVLILGGDCGMAGAAILAASAAARAGAGLVSCGSRAENIASIVASRPEVMARAVETSAELEALLERASVVAIGPGLGRGDWGLSLLRRVLELPVPLVVDADALNLLGEHSLDLKSELAPRILTPHPGEAARLLGVGNTEVQDDRRLAVRRLSQKYAATVLLKGAGTLIASGGRVYVNGGGNPGMASGGMGDVLSGIIAALLAQGMAAEQATCLGAAVHTAAADSAAVHGERGMLAMDVVDGLRKVLNSQ